MNIIAFLQPVISSLSPLQETQRGIVIHSFEMPTNPNISNSMHTNIDGYNPLDYLNKK